MEKYGYKHICPGDIFRNKIRKQTTLGKKIQNIVEKGEYVDKKIVCNLISRKLKKILKQNKYFILDGFPRAKVSFEFLHKFFKEHNLTKDICFLQLLSDDKVCVKRILERLVCPTCFKVYNRGSAKSKHQKKCNNCETNLVTRKADTKKIAKKRLEYFHSVIEPLINLARNFYEVKIIKTECSLNKLKEKYEKLAI